MLKKQLKSAIYLSLLMYIYISIFSYNYQDPSLNTATNEKVTNLGGIVGSYLADILVQFLGLASITIATTIVYFLISKRLLKILYLVLINLGICSTLEQLSLSTTARYMHSGIVGNTLIGHCPFYVFTVVASIGIVGLVGWKRTVYSLLFLCKKIASFFPKILFFRLRKTTDYSIAPLVLEEKYRTTRQQPKERQKKATEEIFKPPSSEFEFPSIHLLSKVEESVQRKQLNALESNKNLSLLEQVLSDFGVQGKIISVCYGPVVTLYKLEPQAGTKSARVIGLADDIARSMSALSARISIIRGQNAMGIELPNKEREIVMLRDLLESPEYQNANLNLPIALGKEISGKPVIADLTKMPHLLVAGTTGSGKSVAINTMILSLVYRLSPDECKMIMIDPKMLELSIYDAIPHLITPVVTEPKKAVIALKWIVKEMENRYRMMSYLNVRNVINYNQKITEAMNSGIELERVVQIGFNSTTGKPLFEKIPLKMETFPYIVVIVDEMADLMLVAGKDIECSIQRLAQMARAAGIHIIMATQRPSVDVITGVIKANFPTRISFAVTSKIDSRTILGEQGAEQLLGMGDMLYMASGGKIIRVHGPFVSDDEVQNIVDHLKTQGEPNYMEEITQEDENSFSESEGETEDEENDLYKQAVAIIQRDQKVSTSYIQRQLRIGYNRAANIVERMEKEGIVSAPSYSGKREILVE
ncbi:Putative cell division protein FtsK [Wolbachia endosymbiont of Drosophila simulans wNo]|uniref:FtsK/SpoIIIE family DNA translocase n=1 Tax=unclassified Wolbachia TaxID=2640676 RepID=UPI0002D2562B|nr:MULTISPECIES: DNA translocase FtsK [unclassified Wolbachia]AGJ99339.1 Putative cell division protein FtsK [Wolbachia endosymbiont of Drosophila simulans wNo]QCB62530.1 DNA translocase FtsK [Wolbachia endosymbiont of Drosophila mauritiana]QCB63577.1 DNA translocase FtsK [Wolbachia endosymbiont of Drosophila mauritiana]QWE33148.1 Putative cell division protein FtsK [Wolbachia endosymbiont of Drosophila simulans]TGB07549.1 DNA translocase FtsK [Wolbachia endosymbiont of Drosophila mauritiana]